LHAQPGRIRQLLSRDVELPSPFAVQAEASAAVRERLDQFFRPLNVALAKQSVAVKAALQPIDEVLEASK
jgi:hypothetical protein